MISPAPDPHNDEPGAMREALERDAARMREERFDAHLHYETMRRIRALDSEKRPLLGWPFAALGAACVVILVLGVLFAPWRPSPAPVSHLQHRIETLPFEPVRASAWAYQQAALRGDDALLALLDRDALDLLPPTASPFSILPH